MDVKAVVKRVVNGKHGFYVIAYSEEISGSITFSLKSSCWLEDGTPESKSIVVLSKLVKKQNGWRAREARYFQPSDEKNEKEVI